MTWDVTIGALPESQHGESSQLMQTYADCQAHKLDAMDFFKGFAVHADELPDAVFTAIGRTVWADIGPTAVIMRLVMKVILTV